MGVPSSKNFYDEFAKTFPKMEGKRVAITGTTSGTGFAAADTIAGLGGELILFNRASSRAGAALNKLKEKHPEATITQIDCDLTSFASVRGAAKTYLSKFGGKGLDVLANNAGIMAFDSLVTEDGFDIQMQTNHLSHYLLTHLLFPELVIAERERGEARIVNHSSIARVIPPCKLNKAYLQKTNGKNLGGNWTLPRYKRYQQTKLANSVFSTALHRQMKSKNLNIKILTAHPGVAETDLVKNTSVHDRLSTSGMGMVNRVVKVKQSQYDGALPLLQCITAKEVESGEFWGPRGDRPWGIPSKFPVEAASTNPDSVKMLIQESDAATGVVFMKL
eukprot:TRINITY_DN277_c0_g1_i2.p1 TRINITY_DN277_c0_g1~~TRINITY_DN277_c0_g1_i2.p1  ORF type:complete len:333 (+),score=65.98 TRINITY_DN277_c0_g1_i2:62-1060(+)